MKKMNKKLINYDAEADALAVYISRGKEEEFVDIAPNIVAELDKNGSIIGIEILNASRVLKAILQPKIKKIPVYAS